jgi:hypothetical protein
MIFGQFTKNHIFSTKDEKSIYLLESISILYSLILIIIINIIKIKKNIKKKLAVFVAVFVAVFEFDQFLGLFRPFFGHFWPFL